MSYTFTKTNIHDYVQKYTQTHIEDEPWITIYGVSQSRGEKKDAKHIRPAMALCRGEFQCNEILGWLGLSLCVCVWIMNETSRSVQDCRFTCTFSLSLLWAVARAVKVSETPCCAWRDRSLEVSAVPLVTAALTDLL